MLPVPVRNGAWPTTCAGERFQATTLSYAVLAQHTGRMLACMSRLAAEAPVLVRADGPVGRLTLNRREKRNALDRKGRGNGYSGGLSACRRLRDLAVATHGCPRGHVCVP